MAKIDDVFEEMYRLFPVVKPELNFDTDYQFLVAVMLSAQCTDKRVNKITSELFKNYGTPESMATLTQTELEKLIYSAGFYHNKAKNILTMTNQILTQYNGVIPRTATELEKLRGVGRKTANVVASALYGEQKIGVDTHVLRVTNRLGLVNAKTPLQVEQQWIKKYKKYTNHDSHFRLVLFGRYYCKAQNPKCAECNLKKYCKYYKER